MAGGAIPFEFLVLLVALALAFDFMNGFHDAANSIATVVSTRVLRPHYAVAWAAFFNFIAFLVFGLSVANTIGKGVIEPAVVDHYVILGALTGAILWNEITWWFGLPSSSSHALIGGLGGAAVAKGGIHALIGSGYLKIGLAIVLSPLLGLALGMLLMIAVAWIFVRQSPNRVDRWFRRAQLVSAALYSLGHGGNDAQKTMGQKITKLKPVGGFCAETGGAITLFLATELGIPVSTTHTITGAIVGVGATRKWSAVRWGVAGRIVWAWVLTIPCSAFISAMVWLAAHRSL
jgi:PiT family inorganic phosphate transporter